MVLKKPSQLFESNKSTRPTEPSNLLETLDRFKGSLQRVDVISSQIQDLSEEISSKVSKEELESIMLSHLLVLEENFEHIQKQIKGINRSDLVEFKETVNSIEDVVANLIEKELPKYKKQVTGSDLRLEKKIEDFDNAFNSNFSSLKDQIEDKVEFCLQRIDEILGSLRYDEQISEHANQIVELKESTSKLSIDVEVVERYIANHHKDVINLREEVFRKIELLPIEDLAERINEISDAYQKINEEITLVEGLLNEPSETNNSDPLTPLDQNFVTQDQLNAHYKLFLSRVQQQLSTLGGGGETRLQYLDDIVGIATNASAYDGKFLKYNHSIGKFEFVTVSGGGGGGDYASVAGIATFATTAGVSTYASVSGISTLSQGLTGIPSISVDVLEATDALFTGNISILGDFNKIDSNGIITARSGLTIGIPEIPGGTKTILSADGSASFAGIVTSGISIPTQLRTKSVAEKTTIVSGNTVGLAFTSGGGNVAICTNPTGNITLNVTDIPTDSSFDNHSISFSVIVTQTGTARTCNAVNLNGVSKTIKWSGGSLTSAISGVTTSTGYDIFTFTGINTVGSASTTDNYVILGSVNGGFN